MISESSLSSSPRIIESWSFRSLKLGTEGASAEDMLISAEADRAIRAAAADEDQRMPPDEAEHLEKTVQTVRSLRESIQKAATVRTSVTSNPLRSYREDSSKVVVKGDFLALNDARLFLLHDLLTPTECSFYRAELDAQLQSEAESFERRNLVVPSQELAEILWGRVSTFVGSLNKPMDLHGDWVLESLFQIDSIGPSTQFDILSRSLYEEDSEGILCNYWMIMQLSEDFEGGIASFMESNEEDVGVLCRIKPNTGSCLLFSEDIIYEGEPITSGTKYTMRTKLKLVKGSDPSLLPTLPLELSKLCNSQPKYDACSTILPDEVFHLIFTFLKPKDLVGYLTVCKTWYILLQQGNHLRGIKRKKERAYESPAIAHRAATIVSESTNLNTEKTIRRQLVKESERLSLQERSLDKEGYLPTAEVGAWEDRNDERMYKSQFGLKVVSLPIEPYSLQYPIPGLQPVSEKRGEKKNSATPIPLKVLEPSKRNNGVVHMDQQPPRERPKLSALKLTRRHSAGVAIQGKEPPDSPETKPLTLPRLK
ncbi:2OG-Fe(II) oxygenase family oxidoreductase [Planoprotostelium fungivorum]|uniref:2OG-Fe(II) oxygenase family oxidoreductase n=1 Tax=Planoprotostelium fungivorum TaxID=1890364 RepID=A0A2P6N9F0_9EUKA|nr:2OG-Fe(II) oxygenase family oxidoreductase [Planoprotostelium fungivorum]